MNIRTLILEMLNLQGPSRAHDEAVAKLGGWKAVEENVVYEGRSYPKTFWELDGERLRKLPHFTGSIDAALMIHKRLCPEAPDAGFSWHDGRGKAIVGEYDPIEAANPAIALCLASIQYRVEQIREKTAAEASKVEPAEG